MNSMSAGRPRTRGRRLKHAIPKGKARAVGACSCNNVSWHTPIISVGKELYSDTAYIASARVG